jgi:GNAT superfamily N-acetyltransferase
VRDDEAAADVLDEDNADHVPDEEQGVRTMAIRPFAPGDDLALNDVFHDPQTPADLVVRNLFREDSDSPVTRCVVATLEDSEVLVGAAAIAESPAHPTRAWVHVEVAEAERRRGVGRELFDVVRERAAGTAIDGLPLRARVSTGVTGETAALALGFRQLFTSRVVRVDPTALGGLGADRIEDLQITATGSVALTKAFAEWYAGVNRADPVADMSLGQFNQRFLSEATGAHGAALLKPAGEVTTFAVSYAQQRPGDPPAAQALATGDGVTALMEDDDAVPTTELMLGSLYDARLQQASAAQPESPEFQKALGDAGALLARLSVDTPVALEVTSEMPVVSALVDGLLEAGKAEVLYSYVTLGADRQ